MCSAAAKTVTYTQDQQHQNFCHHNKCDQWTTWDESFQATNNQTQNKQNIQKQSFGAQVHIKHKTNITTK